jgi:hypothetical protein
MLKTTDSPSMLRYGLCALVCLPVLAFGGSPASALPRAQADPALRLLIQAGPPGVVQQAHDDRAAPLADLDEVLRATRLKLEELTEATARVAADTRRRQEVQTLEKDNERLAAELGEARVRQTDLEGSRELAEARIAELTKAMDAARRESSRLDQALVTLRGQKERLDQRLTRADAARLAALDEVRQTRAEMAEKLEAAAAEVAQAEAELASRREELEINNRKLAEAERLRTELAAAKEQLTQAAAAAIAAERARQAAGDEANRLRREAEQARKELTAAKTESARLQIANAELERQLQSLRRDLRSATAAARQTLTVMEKKIDELNAALDLAQPKAADPAPSPEAVEPEPDAVLPEAPSAMAQPPAPEPTATDNPSGVDPTTASVEGAAVKAASAELDKLIDSLVAGSPPANGTAAPGPIAPRGGFEQVSAAPAASRPEQAANAADLQAPGIAQSATPGSVANSHANGPDGNTTNLAMAGPTEPSLADAGVEHFHANLQALNELELKAGGSDLFAGIESANGNEVRVSTTAAWDKLPEMGRESYTNALLDYWLVARGGKRPAVVRIVDASGQVLVEKSSP